MAAQDKALEAQVEALADSLSLCADELHARILAALNDPARLATGISQAAAQALFATEVELRQHANALYMDAATHAGTGLEVVRQNALAVTQAAQRQICEINNLRSLIGIAADLLGLAAAAVSGSPEHIRSTLQALKLHGGALRSGPAGPAA